MENDHKNMAYQKPQGRFEAEEPTERYTSRMGVVRYTVHIQNQFDGMTEGHRETQKADAPTALPLCSHTPGHKARLQCCE